MDACSNHVIYRNAGVLRRDSSLRSVGWNTLRLGAVLAMAAFFCAPGHAQPVDRKAQLSRSINPVYPYDALIKGRGGWAEVSFSVDTNGRAVFLSVTGASDRAFASALQAEIEAIEFIPPRTNGMAVTSNSQQRYEFPDTPALDPVAREILIELRKPNPAIYAVADLDAPPAPVRQPPSAYPWAMRSDKESGRAEIEFVVDRNGRVLFPRIISATQNDFGWAAATAVLRWRYQPPTKGGQKVDARLTASVVFDLNDSADKW